MEKTLIFESLIDMQINTVFRQLSRSSRSRVSKTMCENARQAFRYASFLPFKPLEEQKVNSWDGQVYHYYESFRKLRLDKAKMNTLRSKARQKKKAVDGI